jgi:putative transposase
VIERCFRTLKHEWVWLHHFASFEEAERIIMAWIARYTAERQHSALGYCTPRAWRDRCYQLPQAA